ncbi:hypothetical protein J0910_00370 [Nocardiopsis sp. CNT-189]|uniref:hypothetical protein n=1 Tax=Nocardiopsis oceanisediminis TaxID=2816862 RepID=UPI003B3457AF
MNRPRHTRAVVDAGPEHTVKTFADPMVARREAWIYEHLPWACPRLVDFDGDRRLVIETLPVAIDHPGWRPAGQLTELLAALLEHGFHHRDVHVGNVVRAADGSPRLIDWETVIWWPALASYDLVGPAASGVPAPDIHARLAPQWWWSTQSLAIGRQWGGADAVPAPAGQRA